MRTFLKITFFSLVMISVIGAGVAHYAHADPGGGVNTGGGGGVNTGNGGGVDVKLDKPYNASANINNVCDLINFVLKIVAEIGAIVGVLFLLWSGFLFIKAQGNKDAIQQAKNTFYTTCLGIAILLGASVITQIIFASISSVTSSFSSGSSICGSGASTSSAQSPNDQGVSDFNE